MGGGTSILNHRSLFEEADFFRISDNMCGVKLPIFGEMLTIISVYAHSLSGRANPEIGILINYLSLLSPQRRANVIILGDFNAHVGYQDLLLAELSRIGTFLYHSESNSNGEFLRELLHIHKYQLCSSFGPSRSVLCTWQRGTSCSQVMFCILQKNLPLLSLF